MQDQDRRVFEEMTRDERLTYFRNQVTENAEYLNLDPEIVEREVQRLADLYE